MSEDTKGVVLIDCHTPTYDLVRQVAELAREAGVRPVLFSDRSRQFDVTPEVLAEHLEKLIGV